MFGFGAPELAVIFGIAFLIFGGKKLPEIGAGLGKGISSFKKGLNEIKEPFPDIKQTNSLENAKKETHRIA